MHLVIAKSFARIHWQNLINFGILPLTFVNPSDYQQIQQGDVIVINHVAQALKSGHTLTANIANKKQTISLHHDLSHRQIEILAVGSLINWVKKQKK